MTRASSGSIVAYGKFCSSAPQREIRFKASAAATYSWVAERAFGDGLEKRRFAHVGEPDLMDTRESLEVDTVE